jgi:hypothetical protein
MLRKSKQTAICFLLLVFTTYYVDITFFQHSHIINGVTIVHSHFHGKAHTQSGGHSINELTLISTLSDFQSVQLVWESVAMGLLVLLATISVNIPTGDIRLRPVFHTLLRAPPAFF